MTITVQPAAHARTLISPSLFDRMAARIAADKMLDRTMADRIVEQTLAFLLAAARHVGKPLVPSEPVDVGWHTFILYTRDYAEFCDRVAGRFIHHVPGDVPGGSSEHESLIEARRRTLNAIERAGHAVDHDLWTLAASCGECHEEGNCAASGGDGNENTETRGT